MLKHIKNKVILLSLFIFSNIFFSSPAFAQLDKATDALSEFQVWLYLILGVFSTVYMSYNVIMAMLDKQPWGDVVTSMGKVAVAGAVVIGSQWAFAIFTS